MSDLYIDPFLVDKVDIQASSNLKIRNTQLSRVVFDVVVSEPVNHLSCNGKVAINPMSHLSPKERMVQIAQQTQLMPDAPTLEPISPSFRFCRIHLAVKYFYLDSGRSLDEWFEVSGNHHLFNQVWRKALMLSPGNSPPPEQWRFVLPFQSSI